MYQLSVYRFYLFWHCCLEELDKGRQNIDGNFIQLEKVGIGTNQRL